MSLCLAEFIECSLGANLVIDNFCYVASDSSPLYNISKQSDHYLWRYCILKIWGIWVSCGCECNCSSPRSSSSSLTSNPGLPNFQGINISLQSRQQPPVVHIWAPYVKNIAFLAIQGVMMTIKAKVSLSLSLSLFSLYSTRYIRTGHTIRKT